MPSQKLRAELAFAGRFDARPAGVTFAPGRAVLARSPAGDPTLAVVLREGLAVAYGPRPDRAVRMVSIDERVGDRFLLDAPGTSGRRFAVLLRGACRALAAGGRRLPGVDLLVASDLPTAQGFASSTAYVVALLRALLAVTGDTAPSADTLAALAAHIDGDTPADALDARLAADGGSGRLWLAPGAGGAPVPTPPRVTFRLPTEDDPRDMPLVRLGDPSDAASVLAALADVASAPGRVVLGWDAAGRAPLVVEASGPV